MKCVMVNLFLLAVPLSLVTQLASVHGGVAKGCVGNVTVEEVGTEYVTIKWEEVPEGTKEFVIRIRALNGTLVKNESADNTSTNHTIVGLTPGTEYNISVAAITDPPNPGHESCTDVKTNLAAPSGFHISTFTTTSISLEWVHALGEKDYYQINCTLVEENAVPMSKKTNDSTVTFDGLTQGSVYEVTIETVKAGFQMEDCGSACEETGITVPEPVQLLQVTTVSATKVNVQWDFGDDRGNYGYFLLSYAPPGPEEPVPIYIKNGTELISGLWGNQEFTFSMVTISNYSTINSSSDPIYNSTLTKPDKVKSVTVGAEGPMSLQVSWTPPVNNTNLTHYVFTVNDMDTGQCVGTVINALNGDPDPPPLSPCDDILTCSPPSRSNTSCVVENLEACTNYSVEIFVYNTAGSSESEMDQSTTAVSDVLKPIEGLNQVNGTANTVQLEWKAAEQPWKCPVEYYRIHYTYTDCENNESVQVNVSDDISCCEHNLENLPYAYWDYDVYVEAFTRVGGDGSASQQNTSAKTGESAPGPPSSLTASDTADFTVKLEWQPPERCQRNGDITNYNLTYSCVEPDRTDVVVETNSIVFNGSNTSTEISIGPYRYCTFYLAAKTNEYGVNISQTDETEQSTPGPVQNIGVESANGTSLELVWEEPAERNGPIIHYYVKWEYQGTVEENSSEEQGNETDVGEEQVDEPSILLTGLKAYSRYRITITASTIIGNGTEEIRSAATGVSAPGPVIGIDVQPGPKSVNVTWVPSAKTGPTNYTVYACEEQVPGCGVEHEERCFEGFAQGYNTTWAEVTGLVPNWPYEIRVEAETKGGTSNETLKSRTSPTTPSAVREFNVSRIEGDCSRIYATWDALTCKERNANITKYIVLASGGGEDIPTEVYVDEETPNFAVTANAKADTEFNVTVFAVADNYFGENSTFLINTSTCAPGYPEGDNDTVTQVVVPEDTEKAEDPLRQFIIQLSVSFLTDSTQGDIIDKGYIVAQDDNLQLGQEELTYEEFKQNYSATWREVQDLPVTAPYRATSEDWQIPGNSMKRAVNNIVTEVVGAEADCVGKMLFCNGYLKAGTSYRVKVFACTESLCSLTTYSAPFATAPAPGNDGGSSVAVAVAVPLVLIVLVLAAVGAVIYRKKYYNKSTRKPAEPLSNGLTVITTGVNEGFEMDEPPTHDLFNKLKFWKRKRKEKSVGLKSKPIPKDEFEPHVQVLRKDSDLLFSEEYKMLRDMSPRMDWEIAELPNNRAKNRYTNILAYDHSRVKLLPTEDDEEGSDYINANYMPGFSSKREFIAAQGPLPSTKDDFWRMVWEQNVPIIVMLTKCVERGRQKCDQYWPSDTEPVFYGDLQVQVISESVLDHYTIRIFRIKLGEREHTVKQFHFTTWPDMGSPDTTDALISFVKAVRSHMQPTTVGPMMVHCSAGVGRTGTFVVVDTLLHHIADNDTIDIFGMVLNLRKYRTNIVQTEDQYIYIHECIKDALERNIVLRPPVFQKDDSPVYSNVDTSDVQLEENENLYENVEIRGPVHVARVVESDAESEESAPLRHDPDLYQEDRV